MADGFLLNIDDGFLNKLGEADKKIKELGDDSEKVAKQISDSLKSISEKGMSSYLRDLEKQRNLLSDIASINFGEKVPERFKAWGEHARKSADEVDRLIRLLTISQSSAKLLQGNSDYASFAKSKIEDDLIDYKNNKIKQQQIDKETHNKRQKDIEAAFKEEERLDKERYELWLMRKRSELVEHKRVEETKAKATSDAIARQNQLYREQEEIKKSIQSQNLQAKNNSFEAQKRSEEQYAMYRRMFDEQEKKSREDLTRYTQSKFNEELETYKKNKQEQANVDKHYHDKRQREYEEMFKQLDRLAKKESAVRSKMYARTQVSGDTSKQAEAAYNRMYGFSKKSGSTLESVKSINNMRNVMNKLIDAQNKLNLSTEAGKRKYDELGKKIQRVKEDLDKATQAGEKLSNSHSKLMNTSGQLQRQLALLFSVSAIQGYVGKLIQVRKEFELQHKSLQILLKDKAEADELWQKTIDLAVKSPFRVKELVTYTKQLAAYRIETSKLHDTTKMLADVSAGLGVDMSRLILAFGQVKAANFLRGTELRQFTEAGIPMLDELAKRFTDLEGAAVSSGEVFERISKRLVTFKDVEAVFKNMTSEGGVFYKMQEEQSKTLHGLISNLHDSIDLMLNDIGRANEGVLKGMVSTVRELVENWRMVAVVLQQVGAAMAVLNIVKFYTGWKAVTKIGATAAAAMGGLAGSAAKLRVALSALSKTMMSNPYALVIGGILAVGHALISYKNAIDAANKKYDEMSVREVSKIDRLNALQKKTNEYNAILKDSQKTESEKNKAQRENIKIVDEIKSKYPDVYGLIKQQKDGTVDLTKAIEEQNNKLIQNIVLQQQAKGSAFQDSLTENYQDAAKSLENLQVQFESAKNSISTLRASLMNAKGQGLIEDKEFDKFDKLLEKLYNTKDVGEFKTTIDEITTSFMRANNSWKSAVPITKTLMDVWKNINSAAKDFNKDIANLNENIDNQGESLQRYIREAFQKAGGGEAGGEAAGKVIQNYLSSFGFSIDEIASEIKTKIESLVPEITVKYTLKAEADSKLEDWAERVKEAVDNLNEKIKAKHPNIKESQLFPTPQPGETKEAYLNTSKAVLDIIKETYLKGQKIEDEDIIDRAKKLKDFASAFEEILNISPKKTTGKDWMSEVIKSVKEAHQEYVKLNKTLDSTEAKQMVLEKFGGVFAEAAKNAGLKGISLGNLTFETEQGTIDALNALKKELPDAAKQAGLQVEKAVSEIHGELRVKTKIEQDKNLIDEIENMFGQYEISLELQKLNIPSDLAKSLFNVDTTSLEDIRNKIQSEINAIGTTETEDKGQQDRLKQLNELLKKVDEMEEKERMERLKKYVGYLKEAQSERVKIKLEELRQLQEIEDAFQLKENVATSKMFGMSSQEWKAYEGIVKSKQDINKETLKSIGLSDELIAKIIEYNEQMKLSQEMAKRGVKKEAQEKLSKAEFNAFKKTSAYTMLFSDAEHYSKQTLKIIEDGLKKIRSNIGNMGLSELKELREFEDKFFDIKIKKNPFKELKNSLEEVEKLKSKGITPDGEAIKIQDLEESNAQLQHTIDLIGIVREKGADGLLSVDEKDLIEYTALLNKQPDILTKIINKKQADIDANKRQIDTAQANINTYNQAGKAAAESFAKAQNTIAQMQKAYDSLSKALVSVGVDMEESDNAVQNIGFGLLDLAFQFAAVAVQAQIMGVAINTALGPIGWAAMALSAVATVISGIFGASDKKKERQIKREMRLVEELEQQYKKLEKQIDQAYSLDTIQSATKKAKSNIQQQIASTERQIQLEKSRKNANEDRIQELRHTIEDLREQLKELEEDKIKALGGFGSKDAYKEASQAFVDAWVEAYRETGDGLSGLEEQFDEFFVNMVKKQLLGRGVQKILEPFYQEFDKKFGEYSDGGVNLTAPEIAEIQKQWDKLAPQLNNMLHNLVDSLGISYELTNKAGELSGLQRGIQGITESQADVIAAYLNSLRFFVADNNSYLKTIAASYANTDVENPMVSQLRIIAQQTSAIYSLLDSLTAPHPSLSGRGLKVIM